MLNALNRSDDSFEGAYAALTEDQGAVILETCLTCEAIPQVIRCLHSGNGDHHYEYFVACGCKAGVATPSRHGATSNWLKRLFYKSA